MTPSSWSKTWSETSRSASTPLEATRQAMSEVTGPIIAIALVLCAVFIPTAFISGLTGQFYKQFAITIAISTVISAFNSLTLSPALCAVLLKGHGAKKDMLSRTMDELFGWFFRPFNRVFDWAGNKYASAVGGVLRKSVIALLLYGGLVFLTGWSFHQSADRLRADAGQTIPRSRSRNCPMRRRSIAPKR